MLSLRNLLLLVVNLVLLATSVFAAVQRSFINGDFEVPKAGVSTACNAMVDADNIPGWETTHSEMPAAVTNGCSFPSLITSTGRIIEIWGNSFQGEQPQSGFQVAELNAVENATVYQKICINNGEDVAWSFAHKARSTTAPNQMAFVVGPSVSSISAANIGSQIGTGGIVQVESYSNGTGSVLACQTGSSVGTNTACTANSYTTPSGTKWMQYAGNFKWNGTGGDMYIAFGSLLGDPGYPSLGNHMDNVKLTLKPYIEFYPSAGMVSNAESVSNPTNFGLRTTGEFTSPLLVTVTVTGGTATLGTDFTTPSGNASFNVVVPVGNYDGTIIIPLGITVLNDSLQEADETITFSISTSADYQVASTSTCGASPNSNSSITITDDDAAMFSINK